METIEVKVEKLLMLHSLTDWVRKCPSYLPEKKYHKEEFLFIDRNGNFLQSGLDFKVAEQRETYPVTVYRKVLTHEAPQQQNEG